ncbi:MAG: Kazal-type serine protease inhibitor family protein, partial [Candidatus Bilamarchaeaceae archaeon]
SSGQCPSERNEVCGSDGITYTNECYARQAGVNISHTGACGTGTDESAVSPNCVDSDNGKNVLEYGTASKGSESFNDSCSPNTNAVYEYFCLNNAITSENVPCPAGTECGGGKCVEILCSDTDSGQDILMKGTIKKGSESFSDSCNGTSVLEYYCSNNQILSKVIACPSGKSCEDGACVVSLCTDSDGGFNLYEKGSARGTSGITYVDVCSGGNGITEYYCSDGNVFHTTADCGNYYVCSNGACISATCRDTDGGQNEDEYGSVYGSSGEAHDACYDEDTVNEYYCYGTTIKYKRIDCDSDEKCVDGECTKDYCYDSDGGKDKDEYGTVEVGGEGWSDYCYDGDTVREYYCSNNAVAHTNMNCDSGEVCSGGKCVKESTLCVETDGGRDYYERGRTTYGTQTYIDYCEDRTDLMEYYCSSGLLKSVVYSCPYGCDGDGACNEGVIR